MEFSLKEKRQRRFERNIRIKQRMRTYQFAYTYDCQKGYHLRDDPTFLGRMYSGSRCCSCSMCGNPRKHYGNSKRGKTLAELRNLQRYPQVQDFNYRKL